jgi:hypothetical protein
VDAGALLGGGVDVVEQTVHPVRHGCGEGGGIAGAVTMAAASAAEPGERDDRGDGEQPGGDESCDPSHGVLSWRTARRGRSRREDAPARLPALVRGVKKR